tara:strand:+ start:6657 stop:6989 length:333 start_codon:yes stop_codon:yes gene_type:complete
MSDQIGLKLTKEMSDSRKGDFAEFYAVTWLWDQGYEVFKNCGCDGMVDLIAWDKENDEFILIDVKTVSLDKRNGSYTKTGSRTPEQIEKGVRYLKFNPIDRQLQFTEHKE